VPVLGEKKERLVTIPGSTPAPDELGEGCEFADRCPFATEKCRQGLIPLYDAGNGHNVRCLKYSDLQEVDEDGE
jgi:peptide/nickel transport system ATP-binding protein/oligopeptide transport system ATP-binding protein